MMNLKNPVSIQQPTDAKPRVLKWQIYQKHRLENERGYICKSQLRRLLGPYEVLESLIEPFRDL